MWASIVKAIAALIKPLIALFIYEAGKKAQAAADELETTKKALELEKGYGEIVANRPDDHNASDWMRSEGDRPTTLP